MASHEHRNNSSNNNTRIVTTPYTPSTANKANEDKFIVVNVTPYPGFVVKTRRLLDHDNKVFINIFHHEYIELEPSNGFFRSVIEKDLQKPYLFMDQPTEVKVYYYINKNIVYSANLITIIINISSKS